MDSRLRGNDERKAQSRPMSFPPRVGHGVTFFRGKDESSSYNGASLRQRPHFAC